MKAVICTAYGPPEVLQLRGIEKPFPKDDEVLIRIRATTAHIGDCRIRRADPFIVRFMFGFTRPKKVPILGMELSGIIEETGKRVTSFKKGDEVFAFTGFGFGAYAEYICLPGHSKNGMIEKTGVILRKPKNRTFEESATVPAGGVTVVRVMKKADIQ